LNPMCCVFARIFMFGFVVFFFGKMYGIWILLIMLCVLIAMVVSAEIEAHKKQKKLYNFFCRIPWN
jgi:hypothetical protein